MQDKAILDAGRSRDQLASSCLLRQSVLAILGAIFVVLIYYCAPKQDYKPFGLVLPSQLHRGPVLPVSKVMVTSDSVLLNPFSYYGQINLELHFHSAVSNPQEALVNRARQLASQLGANLVAIQVLGHGAIGSEPAALVQWVFRARALKVPEVLLKPLEPGIAMPAGQGSSS